MQQKMLILINYLKNIKIYNIIYIEKRKGKVIGMKNIKWTAQELFNSFKVETNVDEFKELYKALLAREIRLDEYTEDADVLMSEILDNEYYRNDAIPSFIDENLVNAAHEEFEKNDFEIDTWF